MERMKVLSKIGVCSILLALLVAGACAVTVTADKHDYKSGETISTHVSGMTIGANYSLKVTVDQFMQPGLPSAVGNTNITWPFSLTKDSFNVTQVNTTQNSVIIREYDRAGEYHEGVFNGSSTNGVFTRAFTFRYDETGTYSSQWVATPMPGAAIVTSIYTINGTKLTGVDEFTANSSVATINPAVARLEIYENDVLQISERFTIDAAAVPTIVPTLTPGSGSDSESYAGTTRTATTTTTTQAAGASTGTGAPTGTVTISGTTATETPAGAATPAANETGVPTTTPKPAGAPFALVPLAGLVLAGALLFVRR